MTHTNYEGIKLATATAINAVDGSVLKKVAALAAIDAQLDEQLRGLGRV